MLVAARSDRCQIKRGLVNKLATRIDRGFLSALSFSFEHSVGIATPAHPVERLGGGVNLIVELSIGKYRHLMQVLGEPLCFFRQIYKAIFDGAGGRAHSHDLIKGIAISGDVVEAVSFHFLDQLRCRRRGLTK
jgi:hypothetical protein